MSYASYASLSDETLVAQGMADLNLSLGFLCALSGGPSASSVSRWLNRQLTLSSEQTQPLVRAIQQLREVSNSVGLPLNFKDAATWKQILQERQFSTCSAGARALGCNPEQVEFE